MVLYSFYSCKIGYVKIGSMCEWVNQHYHDNNFVGDDDYYYNNIRIYIYSPLSIIWIL